MSFSVRPALVCDAHSAVRAFTDIRQALRNAARRKSWRSVRASGHLSVSYVDGRLCPALSAVADLRIAHQDFRRDLGTVFPVVRVQPLDGEPVGVFAQEVGGQLQPSDLPTEAAASFYAALYAVGGGFRPLMFTRGLKAAPAMSHDDPTDDAEPMPMAFGAHFQNPFSQSQGGL